MNVGSTGGALSKSAPLNKSTEVNSTVGVPALNTSEMSRQEVQVAIDQGSKVALGEEQLIRAIDRALKAMQGPSTTLDVSIHEKTHAIMVKVLNKDTGEVIREVPPEKTLDIVAKMMEIAGLLIDERV